jgi:predicted amidophosphoribosyltransferase
MGEKKCPHCGKWSSWNQNLNDVCDHCGKTLGGIDLVYAEKRKEQKQANEEQWIFHVKDTDNAFVKGIKQVGNYFYVLYLAIITFIAWVIAFLPG